MKLNLIFTATSVLYFGLNNAQQSSFHRENETYRYQLAEQLYQTKVFGASGYEFARQYYYNPTLSAPKKEAALFFDTIIGIILEKNHAEEGLDAFMKNYPKSSFFSQASTPLVDYYLLKKDFPKALETLKKINQYQLDSQENTAYIMKLGYTKYMLGDTKGAIFALEEAKKEVSDSEKANVSYMLGHLYYTEKNKQSAFENFDEIKQNPQFESLVLPYYVQLNYNEKDYDKAIYEGEILLEKEQNSQYKAEVHKIVGESYFMKKEYQSAYPHLKSYLESQENPSEKDLYEMGFVCAQLKRYDEAVSYYNQLINSQSELTQNAYYQLGNAYLEVGKKQEALAAFRSSYQMNFDLEVKKLAHKQYAKLGFEIGNPFESPTQVLQDYVKEYSLDKDIQEMRSLLVKSYLYSGDYKATLKAIDSLPNSSLETDKIDQEISYLLGTEEFNKGNLDEAENYFLRSLEFNINSEFYKNALYWLAQTYYQKGNYPSAIARYEKLQDQEFPEKQQLPYDLGYAYFKSKKYEKAQTYFIEYLKKPKEDFKNDAQLRLADTYYANNDLNKAIEIYDQLPDTTDYTQYQKSLALGYKGDYNKKIDQLKNLIKKYPQSDYKDDAQYEIGVSYATLSQYKNADDYFTSVIQSSTDKDLVANASIYKVQNLIDQNQDDKALDGLEKLGEQYKNTSYATKIVAIAKPIFTKNGNTDAYENFAKKVGVSIDAKELDEINLSTAKNYFSKKEYKNAIPFYEKYLTVAPSVNAAFQAKYELGECHFHTKSFVQAVLILEEVAGQQNDYQEDAQTRLAQIYLQQDQPDKAIPYLESLLQSTTVSVKGFAQIELMKLYANKNQFSKAIDLADSVLANPKNSVAVQESALVIKARGYQIEGKDKESRLAYEKLEKSANTEVAAEALYAKAFYLNKSKNYKNSNEVIFKLANNYASEEYWGAKALLVLAKNYIGLKDNYQASYTCDQIISNYSDFPEIIAEAQQIKKTIKK